MAQKSIEYAAIKAASNVVVHVIVAVGSTTGNWWISGSISHHSLPEELKIIKRMVEKIP